MYLLVLPNNYKVINLVLIYMDKTDVMEVFY